MNTNLKKTLLASSIALTLGTANVEAALVGGVLGAYEWSTYNANFTTLDPNGGAFGAANGVNMQWDGNAYNASSDYVGPGGVSNITLSSTTPFYGQLWAAHDIQMFMPGSYSFDIALGGGVPETGMMNVTVGAGQLGMHMLWDWNANLNMDIFVVFDLNSVFGSGLLYSTQTNATGGYTCNPGYTGPITKNCLYDNDTSGLTKNQVWMLASADGDGDGVMGIPMMPSGPLEGFSFNFNANLTYPEPAVPLPAAAWLLGSGLMGLVAAARRRKRI
jgi:hypothetical protein